MCKLFALSMLCMMWGVEAKGGARPEADVMLKKVDELVMQGRSKYKEVISDLTTLLEKYPDNQKALYKRAEVRELLKDHTVALQDLQSLLNINAESKMAYQLRSKILTRLGRFEEAWKDWEKLTHIYKASKSKIEQTKKFTEAVEKQKKLHEYAHHQAWIDRILEEEPNNEGHLRACILHMEKFMDEAKEAQEKYRLRKVDCAMKLKDFDTVNQELGRILALQPQNLGAMHLKAKSLKSMGATTAAISQLKRCLQLDPEEKDCKALHKSIRKYEKLTVRFEDHINGQQWSEVLTIIAEAYELDSDPHNSDRLHLYKCRSHKEIGNAELGKNACQEAIDSYGENNPGTWELFVFKAEIHMMSGELEELETAQSMLNKASELNRQEHRIEEIKHRLQSLIKRAKQGDYYKILGVAKISTDKEIKKAYRVLAMKHHPDKLTGEMSDEEREKAGEFYRKISNAYQILQDADKRRRYDLGEDVEDNQQQQQHHHHGGFHQHFRQGGGGGGGGNNFHFRWG